jgi:hypothetical protein
MTTNSIQANEGRLYWNLSRELQEAREQKAPDADIELILKDLQSIVLHTQSDVLRSRARALIATGSALMAGAASG